MLPTVIHFGAIGALESKNHKIKPHQGNNAMNDYDLYCKIESLKHKIASYNLNEAFHGLCSEQAKDLYLMQSKLDELQNRLYRTQQATDNVWRTW